MWPFSRKIAERTGQLVKITMKDGDIRIVEPWRLVDRPGAPWLVGKWGRALDEIDGEDLWALEPDGRVSGQFTYGETTWVVL